MSSDEYYSPHTPDSLDSGQSTVSQTQVTSGARPADNGMAHEQGSLARELHRWKRRYDQLEAKYRQLLHAHGMDVDKEMRSLTLSDEEHSFELLGANLATETEPQMEPQQPESAQIQPPSAYLEKQKSKERSVVSGDRSFTIMPKEGKTSSYRDSLKSVSECSEGGSELYCVKAENERLHKEIKDLETQLSLAEARVEESHSISKPVSAQSAPSQMGAGDDGATKGPTTGDPLSSQQEELLRSEVSALQEEMSSLKEELTKAKEDTQHALQEGRDMKEALDRTIQENLLLQNEVKEHKKTVKEEMAKAKDWKMQLDETTCRLIAKQDEVDALRQT